MKNYLKYSALVTTIALVAVLEGPANAIPDYSPEATASPQTNQLPIVASTPTPKAKPTTKAKPKATTKPTPAVAPTTVSVVPQSTETVAQAPVTTPTNIPAVIAPVPAPAPVKAAPVAVEAAPVTPATPAVSASGKGQAIANAALSQIGAIQDCTALVSRSLAAVGISFHDWPAGYMSLGSIVSTPQVGDLIFYQNGGSGVPHIAVYIGNGQAVHGGWNGNQTQVQSANVGSGPVYIRVA
jgi:cell wall-associated NlpC family hydrolase